MDDIDMLIGLEMSRKKSGLEPQTAEFVVMNRQVQSEANIKDLQIFMIFFMLLLFKFSLMLGVMGIGNLNFKDHKFLD